MTRCGVVAVIGAPNAGKSTLVNQLVGQKVAITSAKAQTTRARLLGKQARDDGAADSDNVLGDIMEALLGASMVESGFAPTREVAQRLWGTAFEGGGSNAKHPKSALQEWAAGSRRKPPEYEVVDRSGPDHAARFTVRVSVHNVGQVEATASSKQDAETEAARMFMEQFG